MTISPGLKGHLTQAELERVLWDAANALRGPVDAADFKAYVFPVFFFKWISDSWDFYHAEALEEYGEDLTDEIEADYQIFSVPDGCHWTDVHGNVTNTGVKLSTALQRIEQANPDLAGVFGDVQWANKNRLPDTALRALLDCFHAVTLDPDHVSGDMLGSAYEYMLREFAEASGKKAGEFFTPRHVVHLLVKILEPSAGESVYDPACGSAGMLLETINAVRADGGDPRTLSLHGQEVNLTTSAIAKMNLYLHDQQDFHIVRGDSLRQPKFLANDGDLQKFDVVIANPPFSLQNWGEDTWKSDPWKRNSYGVPPAKNADFAWIEHMVASMNPDAGRVGVVMPHGVLFRGGREGQIRQNLIQSGQLEAVIGLPVNLFYSTTIPVCLLIFRANKPAERQGKVLFVDASSRFNPGKNMNTLSDQDVEVIDIAYRRGEDADGDDDGLSLRLVDLDEIEQNNFNLNVGRYISTSVIHEADVPGAIAAWKESREALEIAEATLFDKLKAAGFDA